VIAVPESPVPPTQASKGISLGPAPDRRSVLLAGAAFGAGALAHSARAVPAGVRLARRGQASGTGWTARPGAKPTPADWAALRASLSTHELSLPGEQTYRHDLQLFDPSFDSLRPAGVAYCGGHADVSACLSFVQKFGLPVRARSGGHSYAGWSSVNGGLIVDVTKINHFSLGSSGNISVGTGLDLITLYSKLAAHGRAMPGGSCPTVGIAGLALGGGVGVLSRQYGLTSDNLESVQIVVADGSFLTCDATQNSDLYWACRGGGGGNFGIATTFAIRTQALGELTIFFLTWPWSQAGQVVRGWQSWAPFAADALWSNMHLGAAFGGPPAISVGGTFIGSVAELDQHLAELYRKVGRSPSSASVFSESILNAMLYEAGCSALSVSECTTGPGGQLSRVPFYAKSDFFTQKLSASGVAALLAGIERISSTSGASGGGGSISFDAFGGELNKPKPDATAWVHRDALWLSQYYTQWTYPGNSQLVANQHAWLRQFYRDLHPHASGQAYQNYIDPDLTNWRSAYYGANYARLSSIKQKYDPAKLFSFPQAITF
jgi:FAD/FMN-containing dehydrogenase